MSQRLGLRVGFGNVPEHQYRTQGCVLRVCMQHALGKTPQAQAWDLLTLSPSALNQRLFDPTLLFCLLLVLSFWCVLLFLTVEVRVCIW